MVYFGTIGQLYKTTSFLVVSTYFHSEMRKSVGNNKETTSPFFHYYYQTKTCNQGNHSVVKTTNLFLQCRPANLSNRKTLPLEIQVGVAPIELLVSHTYRRKMCDFRVRNHLNTSLVSPTFAHTICVYAV